MGGMMGPGGPPPPGMLNRMSNPPLSMNEKVYPPGQPMVFNSQNPSAPPIYPCGTCRREVHDNDQAILCESGCNFWYHRACTGLTETAFVYLTQEVFAEWVCDSCFKQKEVPVVKFKPWTFKSSSSANSSVFSSSFFKNTKLSFFYINFAISSTYAEPVCNYASSFQTTTRPTTIWYIIYWWWWSSDSKHNCDKLEPFSTKCEEQVFETIWCKIVLFVFGGQPTNITEKARREENETAASSSNKSRERTRFF